MLREFTPQEHRTWRRMYELQDSGRESQIHPLHALGLRELGIGPDRVPDLHAVNRRLRDRTGFVGVPVNGLEGPESFYAMLARREFPIGNFIRDASDLSYTPAPDVFHDMYGHLPFLVDAPYAEFCERMGQLVGDAVRRGARERVRELERLFWFTVEFGLIETPQGLRVWGAGIASSVAETAYALGTGPERVPFDLAAVCAQEFKIDEFQKKLFVLKSPEQLYACFRKELPQ